MFFEKIVNDAPGDIKSQNNIYLDYALRFLFEKKYLSIDNFNFNENIENYSTLFDCQKRVKREFFDDPPKSF